MAVKERWRLCIIFGGKVGSVQKFPVLLMFMKNLPYYRNITRHLNNANKIYAL